MPTRTPRPIIIGTRASKLALAQTELVRAAIQARHPDLDVHVVRIITKGDVLLDQPLTEVGGKGLFVAEIEQALRAGEIDLAVHSAKDLPAALPEDLRLAAFPPRADARDVVVSRAGSLASLPAGARVGTSSPRRVCQLLATRPDLDVRSIRGNVDTRLRMLEAGKFDAIVLAAAGLIRLSAAHRITEWLPLDAMLPSVGQGALAIETRADDSAMVELVAPLNDHSTAGAVWAERAFLGRLGVGCAAAVAAHAVIEDGALTLRGLIGHPDGRMIRGLLRGTPNEAVRLGAALADSLVARGGAQLLAECRPAPGYAGD